MAGICLFALMGHYLYKARIASNMWRANIRVRRQRDLLSTFTYCPKCTSLNLTAKIVSFRSVASERRCVRRGEGVNILHEMRKLTPRNLWDSTELDGLV